MVGQTDILETEYKWSSAQIESRLSAAPDFMRHHVLPKGHDDLEMVIMSADASSIYTLPPISVSSLGQKLADARTSFNVALNELQNKLAIILENPADPDALENDALLFWPDFTHLHSFLGMSLRSDELIAAFDELRAQFRLRPVTLEALTALHQVLRKASEASELTTDLVDECRDLLEAAGMQQRFPLTFSKSDED